MSRSELDTDTSIISETHDFLKHSQKSISLKFEYLKKFLFSNIFHSEYFEEKSNFENIRYYPLPTEESYEDFLKKVKSEQCKIFFQKNFS
jgi:hypothetical protein